MYQFIFFIEQETIDNEEWITIHCSPDIGKFIEQQSREIWTEYIDFLGQIYSTCYTIHQKLYTLIQLKYCDARI